MSSTADTTTQIIRWTARLIGAGLAGMVMSLGFVAMLDVHTRPALDDLLTVQGIMTVDLWAIVLVGLLVAFIWEGLGGASIMLAALAMQAYGISRQPEWFDPRDTLIVLLGLAFLVCWWRTRQVHVDAPALKPPAQRLRLHHAEPRPARQAPFAVLQGLTAGDERISAGDQHAEPKHLVAGWVPRLKHRGDLDAVRARMECGPGGDMDADGHIERCGNGYVPGLKQTVSTWMRLHERVQRGELGGADDGLA